MNPVEQAAESFDAEKVGFFRYRKLGDKYLLTNDVGQFSLLAAGTFAKLLSGELSEKSALGRELQERRFLRSPHDQDGMVRPWRDKNAFLWRGPGLHIVVVTLRCNHRCVYCQASAKDFSDPRYDMTEETARKVVDTIFESPNPALNIEFQGGEPLANWPIVRYIADYAREKSVAAGKKVAFSLVSNMSLMDGEKLDWLLERGFNFCTSLDGPADVHNKNRVFLGGNSHADTVKWWKVIMKRTAKKPSRIDGLLTTTRHTLAHPRQVVEEYVRLGARGISLRFMNPFGLAQETWEKVGYSAQEFLEFYRAAMDHILEVNAKGRVFAEQTATTFLIKILANQDSNFLDLRSPCGAGIGQIAYNYDGRLFTCDEGRMLGEMGDAAFCIGRAEAGAYPKLINHSTVRKLAVASCLESQTECSWCAYHPYCGVCPIYNYVERGDVFGMMPRNSRCQILKGIQDYLFTRLQEPKTRKVFEKWVHKARAPGIYLRT